MNIRFQKADLWLLVLAVAGFGLAWVARHVLAGDIAVRAQLIGAGKVAGWIGVILFVVQLLRRQRADD